jgi:hypothetical protein
MDRQNGSEFTDLVFPAELEEIRQRRENAETGSGELSTPPSTNNELVGLALSGGGIRSATFSLGVIQALCHHGMLKYVDILSTVSGGGYIGSCLSALLNNPVNKPQKSEFPLRYTNGAAEPRALTHLRNCSNYLAPSGLLPKLRLPNLMLRGILLNLFVFLPFVMAMVFLTELAYEKGPHWDNLQAGFKPLLITFVVMALAFPFLVRILRGYFNWQRRNAYELLLTVPLLLAGILLFMIPFLNLTRLAIDHSTQQAWELFAHLQPDELWKGGLFVFGVLVLFMLAGKASENVNHITGKLLLWVIGLLGPAIILAIYFFLCLWQIDSPFLNIGSVTALNQAVESQAPFLATEGSPHGGAESEDSEPRIDSFSGLWKNLFGKETGALTLPQLVHELHGRELNIAEDAVITCKQNSEIKDARFGSDPCDDESTYENWKEDKRVWLIDNSPGTQEACPEQPMQASERCTYITRGSERSLRIEGAQLNLFDSSEDVWFFSVFAALLILNRMLLDINITSPHGFYRDRLSKAFLFKVDSNNEIQPEDKLAMSTLNAEGTVAPYHIINVTLNLQGSKDPDLRGRESDFFIFTKRYTGSDRTGYTETAVMESLDRHFDLATAMAISGAAAAPNMGTTTNRSLVFIMTLLNIRLGYWLPNPALAKSGSWLNRLRLNSAQSGLILKEALGRLDAKGHHVNVSDGGHIENLGIYPLLKRQCKFIIAVDGEADPQMGFHGLVTLMRFARIDMGVEIALNLDDIRKNSAGLSKSHSTLGKIFYANGEVGHLLYIKLSVTGDEPEYVRAYRAQNPEYPHESTADQFFSEEQFEAYRALGEHACETLFSDPGSIGDFAGITDRPASSTTA